MQIILGKVAFRDSGSWEPDFFGVPGRAPANYGVRAGWDVGSLRVIGLTALRQCTVSLERTNLALTNQTFAAKRIPLQFTDSSVLDYRFLLFMREDIDPDSKPIRPHRFPNFNEPRKILVGRAPLVDSLENRSTNSAQFTIEQERETLVIPFSARYRFATRAPSGDEFRYDVFFEGEIVAAQEALIFAARSPEADGALRLWWPDGFRLQQSKKLDPAEWLGIEGETPFEITTSLRP